MAHIIWFISYGPYNFWPDYLLLGCSWRALKCSSRHFIIFWTVKSREEIIDELAVHGKERKDVQLILGVALQETGRFKEAFDVFCELADNGSVAGKFQKATYLYDGNNVEKDQKTAIALMDEVMTIAKEEGLTDLYRSSAECLGMRFFKKSCEIVIHNLLTI